MQAPALVLIAADLYFIESKKEISLDGLSLEVYIIYLKIFLNFI